MPGSLTRKDSGPSDATREAVEEAGEEPTKRLNADVPESLYKRVRMRAVQEDCSIKDVVIAGMNKYLSE